MSEYNFWLVMISPIAALVLNLVFLKNLRFSAKGIMIILFTIVWLTDIFKILHLPGADILVIFSYLLYLPVIGATLLATGFKSSESTKPYLLITGLLLIVQFLIPLILESWNQKIPRMIVTYLLVAASFTAMVKCSVANGHERKLLTLVLLLSVLNIIHSIFQ